MDFRAPSTRIRVFFNPQLFLTGLKNFDFHTYPDSNRICPSTRIRHVSGFNLVLRTSLGILATEHASFCARNLYLASALKETGNEVAILNTVFTVKNWARSFYVTGLIGVHTIPDS